MIKKTKAEWKKAEKVYGSSKLARLEVAARRYSVTAAGFCVLSMFAIWRWTSARNGPSSLWWYAYALSVFAGIMFFFFALDAVRSENGP